MFLTLDLKRLSPHQVTSVLGLIMQNNLALIPTVKYRMNSLTTIVLYPWKVAVAEVYTKECIYLKSTYTLITVDTI